LQLAQKKWINRNIEKIHEYRAKKRYEELKLTVDNFGDYLYNQGRCAVAHAFEDDVIDPDISELLRRLEDDVWLIKGLAELMISQDLDIMASP
jgi:hypothetical protein